MNMVDMLSLEGSAVVDGALSVSRTRYPFIERRRVAGLARTGLFSASSRLCAKAVTALRLGLAASHGTAK
jgi:hypothetical protein